MTIKASGIITLARIDNGSIGPAGVGVSAITGEFYLSTSKTAQSGASWVTTPPAWSPGKYLWTRYKIGYTNGSTAYTTPQCSSEWEAVNNLQVGGRNLYRQSASGTFSGDVMHFSTTTQISEKYGFKSEYKTGSDNSSIVRLQQLQFNGIKHAVISFNAYVNTGTLDVVVDICDLGSTKRIITTTNTRYSVFVDNINKYNTSASFNGFADFSFTLAQGQTLYVEYIMVEYATTPSNHSPAPEDTQDQIDQANINISNKVDQEAYDNDKQVIYDDISKKLDDEEFRKFQKTMNDLKSSYESFVGEGGRYEKELQNASKREQAIIQEFGEKVQQFNFINTYIRESEEGIVIGAKGNPMQMLLSKDSLSFMDGGQVVAYFSNQSFYINRGAVVESLQVGVHKLTKIDNNHTVIQYIPQ